MRLIHLLFVMALFATSLTGVEVRAASLEELVMPGKVIEGHVKYERECERCHQPFSKQAQAKLCLDCHEKVAQDVSGQGGFHGRIPGINDTECKVCHTEHLGRGADVVQFDKETFNHGNTDFELNGSHLALSCGRCHKPDKLYREALNSCFSCHEEDDPHQGRLGEKCNECHNERGWAKTAFDHGETDFKLQDAHEKVSCNACHPNERYEKTPTVCYECHRLNDIHGTRYGDKCDQCHTPKAWDTPSFDHDKDTDFKLLDAHTEVACDTCHTQTLFEEGDDLPTDCYGCHQHDDEHQGRFGKKCDTCHNNKAWDKAQFDHDKETDFKLQNSHQELPCSDCHKGTIDKDEERDANCYACHRKDDAHKGQQGKLCDNCHNDRGWDEEVFFDHDLTPFPLIGLHNTTPCGECHLDNAYRETVTKCPDCHQKDDTHKRTLGPECRLCHNPNAWALWGFDHNLQTDFSLEGAHEGMACDACHTRVARNMKKLQISPACGRCHQQDDIHDGGFGPHCERCHDTEAFDQIQIEN